MADYKKLKPFVLKWEGGYVNDPKDSGGQTMRGITLATYRSVFGKGKTVQDLKNMSDAQWEHVFKTKFWDRWKADHIENQHVADILVDWVWASGKYGITIPQQMLGVEADGIVGAKTLAAVNALDASVLYKRLKERRITYCKNLVKKRPKDEKFLKGWINRINDIEKIR